MIVSLLIWAFLAFVFWRQFSIHDYFLNDAFVFIDGIHRLVSGQTPHVDFSTPVGALAYWLPSVGFQAIGGYAGAIEVASLMLCGFALAIASFLLVGRASGTAALLGLGTIAGIIVIPLVPGWAPSEITNAMHYNRWGWGLLLPVFLLALAPPAGPPTVLNGIFRGLCGGLLIAALFYIKITYFLFALAFLPVLGLYSDQRRRDAAMVLAATMIFLLATFLAVPGLVPAYFADITQALGAGDGATRDPYWKHAFANRNSIVLLILAAYAAFLREKSDWRDIAAVGYIFVASLAIIDQNFQFRFLVILPAAFVLLATNRTGDETSDRLVGSVALAAGIFMVLPFAADWARVTVRHLSLQPKNEYLTLRHPDYGNVFFAGVKPVGANPDQNDYISLDSRAYLQGDIPLLAVSEEEYLNSLVEGMDLLNDTAPASSVIVTFDYSNTLAPLVNAPREPNGLSWWDLGRNVSSTNMPAPERYFDGVDIVMIPKVSRYDTASRLLVVYGDYILENMTEIVQSDSWIMLSTAAPN